MADDGSAQGAVWPLPKFYFLVEGESFEGIPFQEVSGLDIETQPVEYRGPNDPLFSTIKMPGLVKESTVTLKKGVFASNHAFFDWMNRIKMNTIQRETITIKLLDETGGTTIAWSLLNAFPTKITGTDLRSDGNEVAVESIELVYEGLTISNT